MLGNGMLHRHKHYTTQAQGTAGAGAAHSSQRPVGRPHPEQERVVTLRQWGKEGIRLLCSEECQA